VQQRCQAQRRSAGATVAAAQSAVHGVSTRVLGTGGHDRCERVSVLQGLVFAVTAVRRTTEPGAAVSCGHPHSLEFRHKGLWVALRAVLERLTWGRAIRLRNAMTHGYCPSWPRRWLAESHSSPVIIRLNIIGEAYKAPSPLPHQAVQSNMVYQPREASMVSTSIAARLTNADR
jgi:hypothetical protein